jgi:hypothetical protein
MSRGSTRRVAIVLVTAAASAVGCTAPPTQQLPEPLTGTPFTPAADSYVDAESPSMNFGMSPEIVAGGSPIRRALLTFDVTGLTGSVTSARLRIHVQDSDEAASSSGGRVTQLSETTWPETSVTFARQPALDGATLATLGPVSRNTWYQVDVSPAITGNGTYSFGIASSSADSAHYDSRESGVHSPKLVVTTAAHSTDPVLVGAGDIASCRSTGDEATASLLDGISGTVFTTGDNAYGNGSSSDFRECYGPSWGRHLPRTRPAPGNHDYKTPGARGYFQYFGSRAGDPDKGYYSYDLGSWHVVVINSNCAEVRGCHAGSAQERWLRTDLAASSKQCTAAYWHHPLFTSGSRHRPSTEMRPIFQALYDHRAEIVVTGHNHNYERFAPQDPDGRLDAARGIAAFVAGTGGRSHYRFGQVQPNSEVRGGDTYGVLKLTLKPRRYDWEFIPEVGKSFTDSGSGRCH